MCVSFFYGFLNGEEGLEGLVLCKDIVESCSKFQPHLKVLFARIPLEGKRRARIPFKPSKTLLALAALYTHAFLYA